MLRKWDAFQTYLFLRGLASFAFTTIFTINMVYQVTVVGLNPLQLVLVGTTLELSAFFFEIPTGVVADVYSRRLSIIIGYAMIGVGFIVEGIPTFATVLLAQVIWGIGFTFTSGATDAWIVDEIGQERANQAFLRGSQIASVTAIIGIVLSVFIASQQMNYPHFVGGGALIGMSIALLLIMPEVGFKRKPADERDTWNDMFQTLGDGVRHIRASHILTVIVLSSLIGGAFSEGWDRLWTKHLVDNIMLPTFFGLDSIYWFGLMGIISSLLSLIGAEVLQRMNLVTNKQLATANMILFALWGTATIVYAQSGNFMVAITIIWFIGVVRSLIHPMFASWINLHIDSKVRATVLSVDSQANALGQSAMGPVIGYIGLVSGLRLAMSLTGLVMYPAVFLIAKVRNLPHDKAKHEAITT